MSVNLVSKVLPYALMAFVGLAGWSMQSTTVLSIVVFGTMGIAIGTALTTRPQSVADQITDLSAVEQAFQEHQQALQAASAESSTAASPDRPVVDR